MPVIIGNNLDLDGNKLSALYKQLYSKLNKAYAWTNTQTSGSNGTISVYSGTSFVEYLDCSNINNFYYGDSVSYSGQGCYILNGKIYRTTSIGSNNDVQVTSDSDWIKVSFYNASSFQFYAINSSGKLYYIKNNTKTQIGSDTTWTDVSHNWAINNGKLYNLSNATATQYGTDTDWISLTKKYDEDGTTYPIAHKGDYYYGLYSLQNIFVLNGVQNAKFVRGDISTTLSNSFIIYVNTDDEVYIKKTGATSFTYAGEIPNINKINSDPGGLSAYSLVSFLTSDGKSGFICPSNGEIIYFDETIFWSDITNLRVTGTYTVDNVSTRLGISYAIGDGKLYVITVFNNNSSSYSPLLPIDYFILDNNINWKKLYGSVNPAFVYSTTTKYYSIFAFNSEDSITTTTTVYTTKTPQLNDVVYENANMFQKSVVRSASLPLTVTDDYFTYTRDSTKDSHFTEIPPATVHETVSVMDILNATNPNL